MQAAFVHLGSPERAKPYFDYYNLSDVERVSNPDGSLYSDPVFALARVSLWQLFRPAVWIGSLRGAILNTASASSKKTSSRCPAFSS